MNKPYTWTTFFFTSIIKSRDKLQEIQNVWHNFNVFQASKSANPQPSPSHKKMVCQFQLFNTVLCCLLCFFLMTLPSNVATLLLTSVKRIRFCTHFYFPQVLTRDRMELGVAFTSLLSQLSKPFQQSLFSKKKSYFLSLSVVEQ